MSTPAIRVTLLPGGMGRRAKVLEGDVESERAICQTAEESLREELMRGNGIGYQVSCHDPVINMRLRGYLIGVSHEVMTWPGEPRMKAQLR